MPWSPKDAKSKTKKAKTPKKQKIWSDVANKALASGDSEGSAIRQANAVVAGTAKHKKKSPIKSYIESRKKATGRGK
jgi:uncharacterized protein YdaT